jgi:hypothetical protein
MGGSRRDMLALPGRSRVPAWLLLPVLVVLMRLLVLLVLRLLRLPRAGAR